MQPMSAELFEQLVLSKPYFDNRGLIVALDGERAIGFVHAAFGPSEDRSTLSHDVGVISMLMVRREFRRKGIGGALLARAEEYLGRHGSREVYGGGNRHLCPFYLGLYGGSELPGVLASDADAQRRYRGSGYEERGRVKVFHFDLRNYKPPMDRTVIQLRRNLSSRATIDPPAASWWEACTLGTFARTRHELIHSRDGARIASATTWSIEPLSTMWGVRAVGLVNIKVEPAHQRGGLAYFLIHEIFRTLPGHGVSLVESQVATENTVTLRLFQKIGFTVVDEGVQLVKALDGEKPAH